MKYQIPFSFIPCQTCNAKIHCEQCAREVTECLLKRDGVFSAEIDMKNKIAYVEGAIDCGDLEECMEDLGLFPD